MDSDAKKQDEPDPRNTLKHVLQSDPDSAVPPQDDAESSKPSLQPLKTSADDTANDMPSNSNSAKGEGPLYTATTTTTRRNANGSVSSVYSGNKIRHLKKEDGVPLWRRDIQFDFLTYIFNDDMKVFHKASDGSFGHTFADVYLDAMAKSSKCSKILKDKLLTERPAALNMAMVCLLVNVGRMNTTLNFFPEMRAQLRTYHSIPSLQAHQDPNAYKQLQDAPRLKSILKGATEDTEQPSTLEDIKSAPIPRTNPVNLIFALAQFAPKISEMHFDVPRDFFDLVVKSNLSSRSRATAFLWLMWWYLESDFSEEAALKNPYGPGRKSKPDDPDEMPIKCPQFETLSDEQEEAENVDTPSEREFGLAKQEERRAILAADMAPVITGAKRTGKRSGTGNAYTNNPVFQVASEDGGISSPSRDPNSPAPPPPPRGGYKSKPLGGGIHDYPSDTDRTRSASPPPPHKIPPHQGGQMGMFKPTTGGMRITSMLNDQPPQDSPAPHAHTDAASTTTTTTKPKGPGRGNWRRQHRDGVHHTPKSFAARQKASAHAHALDAAETASAASAASAALAPGAPAPTAGAPVSGPHGFYLPLDGSEVVPKRSRPLTHHQMAVEQFRRQKVNYILYQSMQRDLRGAERRRRGAGSRVLLAWERCVDAMGGDGERLYDSEDEERRVRIVESGEGGERSGGGEARLSMTMAGLRAARWEEDDFGEGSMRVAAGLRRVRRRLERWEKGEGIVRRRKKGGDMDAEEEEEMENQQVTKMEGDDGGRVTGDPMQMAGNMEDDADVENEGEGEDEVLGEEEQDAMDEDDNETIDAVDAQDEVMAGV